MLFLYRIPLLILGLAICALLVPQGCLAYENADPNAINVASNLTPPPAVPMRLQGGVEVKQLRSELRSANPRYDLYMASQNYYQAQVQLQYSQFKLAADAFKRAGDLFHASVGECSAMANARYGEAGARMLIKEDAQAAKLFQESIELFKKYDPYSPYLKAAMDYSAKLTPKPLTAKITVKEQPKEKKLEVMIPKLDHIDKNITLNPKLTQLEDGTKIYTLKATDFFNGSKYVLPEAAALDLREGFVNDTVYKAFLKMDCLEFAALGSNYMTANNNYKPFKSGEKSVAIGASDQFWSPVVHLKINGKEYAISMDLPGISKNSKNVLLVTDLNHVLAIDPRTNDTWKLVTSFNGNNADFSWWKLTHVKKNIPGFCKPAVNKSLFAKSNKK